MKTAMQVGIEIIEERLKILSSVQRTESTIGAIAGHQYSKYLLMELLEKEKEQIITDYSNGFLNALGYKKEDKNIEYGVIMQSKAEADIYYNETYNQNK
jgi:hypothetical protein